MRESRGVMESLALAAQSAASVPFAIPVAGCQSSQKCLASLRGRHWNWEVSYRVGGESLQAVPLLRVTMPLWWTGSSRPWVGSTEINDQVRTDSLVPC